MEIAYRRLAIQAGIGLAVLVFVLVVVLQPQERLAVRDTSWERVRQAGKLVIATDASYPPLADVAPDGRLVGFDVDVAIEICRRLQLEPVFVNSDLGGMVDAILTRNLDVIVSGWLPAEEHHRLLRYSISYFEAGQVLVTNRERGGPVNEEQLARGAPNGTRWQVAVEQGSTAEILLRERRVPTVTRGTPAAAMGMELHLLLTPQEALINVAAGTYHVAVVDHLTALQWSARYPQLQVSEKQLSYEPYVVAGRVIDYELMHRINDVLVEMHTDGWLKQAQQRWLAQPPQ